MKIISSFYPTEALQENVKTKFPHIQFEFYKKMNEAKDALSEAEVLLTYGEDLTEELLEKATQLKWIMVMSAGLEKMPFEGIKARNILVTNVRGIHSIPMAEFAFGYMLQHAKRLHDFEKQKEQSVWKRIVPLQELYGRTLLVVGAGAIGSQIGKYGKTFGMTVLGINSNGRAVEDFDVVYPMSQLNDVLPKADYVVSILPSTPSTDDVFSADQFKQMKTNAVFINLGRGNAVKEEDLMAALEAGELEHAYLDVFKTEPLPENHPFWNSEKVTITPHLSAVTDMYQPRSFEIFIENLQRYLKDGKDYINRIDVDRGY